MEWGEVVVHRSEEGECCDGNVYPEVAGHSGGRGGGGEAKRGREGGRATDNRNVRMSARDLAIQKQPVPEDYLLEFVFSRESRVEAMRFCAYCLHLGRYNVTIITGQGR